METYYRRVHRWVHFRLQHERCAARMELALTYWGARAARCRSWDCERSSPLSSAVWRQERTRSLGRMCWDRCCHIRSTSRMDCYLHKVGRRYSCTGGIQPCRVACSRWVIRQYHHIRRLSYTALSGPLVVAHCHLVACWRD